MEPDAGGKSAPFWGVWFQLKEPGKDFRRESGIYGFKGATLVGSRSGFGRREAVFLILVRVGVRCWFWGLPPVHLNVCFH